MTETTTSLGPFEGLLRPEAYPHAIDGDVELRETHISLVFLAGEFVYKIKKPLDLGFLDFSTADRRHFFCQEEVRLNRRLAHDVYRAVVPVTRAADGTIAIDGEGETLEHAVCMLRLDRDRELGRVLAAGTADGLDIMDRIAHRLAEFYMAADTSEEIALFGRFDVVAKNARDNFLQSTSLRGTAVSAEMWDRCRGLVERELERVRDLVESRAARGVPRDTHGDLRLDHVYVPRSGDEELEIIDCIEFSEAFRFADPVADVAFLVMDLLFEGHGDLAHRLTESYFAAANDAEGMELLPFYVAYRACVRAKIEGIRMEQLRALGEDAREAERRARAYLLLVLGQLEDPSRRPCLALTAGLPGSGKSTLALGVAEAAGFEIIATDVVRKELFAGEASDGVYGAGLYDPARVEQVYDACRARAAGILAAGGRALIDASFRRDRERRLCLELARDHGVPLVIFECMADRGVAEGRIEGRTGDPSDASVETRRRMEESWEAYDVAILPRVVSIDTGQDAGVARSSALLALEEWQLYRGGAENESATDGR